jgi:hypothetical protein
MQQEFLLTAILLTAMALLAGAALVLSYLHWKVQSVDSPLLHQKVDWRIEYEFNRSS